MTVPTNNEEAEAFVASNGYRVERLADGQTKITRHTSGVFEAVTWCGGDEYLAIAEHALAARRLPVSGDTAELIAKLRNVECYYGGELRDWMRNAAKQAADVLSASQRREAAPSDTDRQFLNDVIYESWNSERGDDIPWIPAVGRFKLAASILAAGFSRTSHPVQVEPSATEYREAYETWRREGQRLHAALLEIWRSFVPDSEDRTFGDDPQEVVRTVMASRYELTQVVSISAAFDRFVQSFNGDEAGDIDDVGALDGATGWAMRGGNDVRAVFEKAVAALGGGE